jgi:hypothetical protein
VFGVRERSHCLNVRAAPLPGGTGPERGVVVLECVDRFASQARSGHFLFDRCESLNCRHPEPPNPRIYCHNSNVKRLVLILLAAVVGGLADAAGASPDATRPSTSAVVMERSQIQQLVLRYAAEYGMDYLLLDALIRTESAYNPNAVSHKGAMGLMQLMPATARRLRVADPFDPEQNIRGGVAEFARLMERYSGRVELALAAYNAGEGAVSKYGGIPPFRETRNYVARIMELYTGKPWNGTIRRRPAQVKLVRDPTSGAVLITNQRNRSTPSSTTSGGSLGGGFGRTAQEDR